MTSRVPKAQEQYAIICVEDVGAYADQLRDVAARHHVSMVDADMEREHDQTVKITIRELMTPESVVVMTKKAEPDLVLMHQSEYSRFYGRIAWSGQRLRVTWHTGEQVYVYEVYDWSAFRYPLLVRELLKDRDVRAMADDVAMPDTFVERAEALRTDEEHALSDAFWHQAVQDMFHQVQSRLQDRRVEVLRDWGLDPAVQVSPRKARRIVRKLERELRDRRPTAGRRVMSRSSWAGVLREAMEAEFKGIPVLDTDIERILDAAKL